MMLPNPISMGCGCLLWLRGDVASITWPLKPLTPWWNLSRLLWFYNEPSRSWLEGGFYCLKSCNFTLANIDFAIISFAFFLPSNTPRVISWFGQNSHFKAVWRYENQPLGKCIMIIIFSYWLPTLCVRANRGKMQFEAPRLCSLFHLLLAYSML